MRWQRVVQAAIALFVIGFIAVLAATLRRETARPANQPPAPRPLDDKAVTQNLGGCEQITAVDGRRLFSLKCGKHFMYADGRQKMTEGVEVSLPRENRDFTVSSAEAEALLKEGGIEKAVFEKDVRITSEGLEVTAAQATYTEADGLVTIPGPVQFTRGRMRGSGVGATYDRNREVLWILDQARIDVAPDPATGEGPMEAHAKSIGLARADHYLRLTGDARISGDGRILQADEVVIRLTDDEQRVRTMELRGASRITGGAGGPQQMSARDIDLAYADDGRTLQQAKLMENAAVQLAGTSTEAGKRISGRTIDIGLGPDGSTVTSLSASEQVVVDLPGEGQAPAKQIRAATLAGSGAPDAGLQQARFGGGVDYRETRAARGKLAAIDRRARSQSLALETAPGLGAIEKADFTGNVTFTEAPDFEAVAPHGIYYADRDRLVLTPGEGLPGLPPRMTDGRLSVAARTIDMNLSTRELNADTRVRSTMQPQQKASGSQDRQLPSMLDENEPVNVTANRLKYSGADAVATYTGDAVLWQKESRLKADTIVVDDSQGNLTASGSVTTLFPVEETDRKTGSRRRVPTRGSSQRFTYDEKRRLATYTGNAQVSGAQGDVSGDKIELFMKADANELERAEAYGTVVVKEGGRSGKGSHLTYTAATDEYLMIGTPVEIIEEKKEGGCVLTRGATARFNRTADSARVEGSGVIPQRQQSVPCPARPAR